MKNERKGNVDLVLLFGLLMLLIFQLFNKFVFEVSDYIAYPWMIISCVLMIIGLYRTGKILGGYLKK